MFLTQVDAERLKIRGSRDPLGLVPLWANLGRKVVGNLTTATTSVRGFTSLLMGYYFAEEFSPGGRDSDAFRLKAFLKVEQLCGYARWHVNNDGDLRGISEVRRRLAEQDLIRISADSSGQILSNQKTYGLWGLYTMATRASGLISKDELQLTPDAREFVEGQLLKTLQRAFPGALDRLRSILTADRTDIAPDGKDAPLLSALARVLAQTFSATERDFYHQHLVLGGNEPRPWQQMFAGLVNELPKGEGFSHKHLVEVTKQARRSGAPELADHLESIRALEALLVPMASLFGYIQSRDGATTKVVVGEVKSAWGNGLSHIEPPSIDELSGVIATVYGDQNTARRFQLLATALRTGAFADALRLCIEHNAFVMRARGGAEPWVVIADGRLDVRYRDEGTLPLVPGNQLATTWQNGFYLNPFKEVLDQLRVA